MSLRDDEGYLIEPDSWTEDIARQFAAEEKVVLSNEHCSCISLVDYC